MQGRKKWHQSGQKGQKQIQKSKKELEGSRLRVHDLTINNKTNRNLDLIIKVQEQFNQQQVSKNESRVSLPQNATYRHIISTSREKPIHNISTDIMKSQSLQKYLARSRLESQGFKQSEYGEVKLFATQKQKKSPVKQQRKFQPLSRISIKNGQNLKKTHNPNLIQNSVQTDFGLSSPFSNFSQINQQDDFQPIQEEGKIQTFFFQSPQARFQMPKNRQITKQSTSEVLQSQRVEQVPLPISVFQNQMHHFQKQNQVGKEQDLSQKGNRDLLQNPGQELNISFSPFQKSGKVVMEKKDQKQRELEPFGIRQQNIYLFESCTKKISFLKQAKGRQPKIKPQFSKNKSKKTKSKICSTSQQKKKDFSGKFQINQTTLQNNQKANDLFLQRKALLLKNLQRTKQAQRDNLQTQRLSRSPAKISYVTQFTSRKPDPKQKKRQQISPRAQQISQRLYSLGIGKLKPCDHYQRFSQSVERQRFYQLINQNSFVGQKMNKEEKEFVFQSLRRSEDSITTWPMKLLNYTYSKLEKIKVYDLSRHKTQL